LGFCKQFRLLGSKKTSIGFLVNYLGMPSWDATNGAEPKVSADYLVGMVSLGYRVDWISQMLSIGGSVKYITTNLDTYSSTAYAGDIGILIKPKRFDINTPISDFGIISIGASLLNIGPGITFDKEETTLPQTTRFGLSLLLGKYKTTSLLLASDLYKVINGKWIAGLGSEFWWHDMIGVRAGYQFNNNNLENFSFGMGFRFDDILSSFLKLTTKHGDGFEFDFADVDYGEALQNNYRGTIIHYPLAPEPFKIMTPYISSSLVLDKSSMVKLQWEEAYDPDPFDKVSYYIMVSKDSLMVERGIRKISRSYSEFVSSLLLDSLFFSKSLSDTSCSLEVNEGGIYYQKGGKRVSYIDHFVIATHDLAVGDFQFVPEKWITTTPEQGRISFKITNNGVRSSSGFHMKLIDVYESDTLKTPLQTEIYTVTSKGLYAGKDTTVSFQWETPYPGKHRIKGMVVPDNMNLEVNSQNNILDEFVYSIPKGEFTLPDTVEVMATGYDSTDIPIVPHVYFPPFSDKVSEEYYDQSMIPEPALVVMARRLQKYPDITLKIMGSIDKLTGEEQVNLADRRAEAVKKILQDLGAPESQLVIQYDHPDKILGNRRMPRDPQDAEMIMQQYRVVSFKTDQQYEEKIFGPLTVAVDTTMRNIINFDIAVVTPSGVREWNLSENSDVVQFNNNNLITSDSLTGIIKWDGTGKSGKLVKRDRQYEFTLELTDSLGQSFFTHPKNMYLIEKRTIRKREVFGAAKFAKAEPTYQFYWDRLMIIARELAENPNMRVKFEGHACAIGSDEVNQRLSYRRATRFTEAFKQRVKNNYPQVYRDMWNRIDEPEGFGENIPLRLKLRGREEKLIGDNSSPVGRYLNRRIMVLLYREHN
ncbi:MAG: CARDB domain-containing protein, partial [bacterium]